MVFPRTGNSIPRTGARFKAAAAAVLFLIPLLTVPALADWTVMVYMAGDNNLEHGQVGVQNIRDMESIPGSDGLNILVQFDRPGDNEFGSFGGARRYLVRPREQAAANKEIASLLLEELGTVNMGDPSSLVDFVRFGIEQYPADHYFLILWNHGTGWETLPYREAQQVINFLDAREERPLKFDGTYQSIAYDDGARDSITALELWEAFERIRSINGGRKIDVVGFDACLMGMIEVGTQIAHGAGIMVASEEIAPETGWNYREFLGYLARHSEAAPRDAARAVIDAYVSMYRTLSQEVVLSSVNLSRIGDLLDGVRSLTEALLAEPRHVLSIRRARAETKMFDNQAYLDLADLSDKIAEELPGTDVARAALELSARIGDADLVQHVGKTGLSNMNAHGLAVYFPLHETDLDKYSRLDFAGLSGWDRYLAAHFNPDVVVLKPVETFLSESNLDGVLSPGETFTAGFRLEREKSAAARSRRARISYRFTADNGGITIATRPGSMTLGADDQFMNIEFQGSVRENCPVDTKVILELTVEGENVATIRHRVPVTVSEPFHPSSDILLVSARADEDPAALLAGDLAAAGIPCDVWILDKNGPVHASLLDHYLPGLVIRPVENGNEESIQVNASEQLVLKEYAARGGSLMLYGQDIGYKLGGTEFFRTVCSASFVRDNTGIYQLETESSARFLPGLSFRIDGGDGSQKWPDELDPIAPAFPVLRYAAGGDNDRPNQRSRYGGRAAGGGIRSSGAAGVAVEQDGHRVVCLSFGLHGIETVQDRRQLSVSLIRWLLRSESGFGGEIETYVAQPVAAGTSQHELMRSFRLRARIEQNLLEEARRSLEDGTMEPISNLIEELANRGPAERERAGSLIRQLHELLLYQLQRSESGELAVPTEKIRSHMEKLNILR